MSDRELLAACRSEEAWAWHEIVRRYRRLVHAIPRIYRLQAADADEVFQQTFSSLLRAVHRMRDPERLEAWLVTTAKRSSLKVLHSMRRDARVAQAAWLDAGESHAPDPAQELEEFQRGERLMRAVDALGEPCRGLVLALFAGPPRPYRLLARDLGVAVGSIGPMRARCLTRLRVEFLRLRRTAGAESPGQEGSS